jgi:hypothetical protein
MPDYDIKECYQCENEVEWLAPDGRCGNCTGWTPEEIRGEVEYPEDIYDD